MVITLVRHGETQENVAGIMQGQLPGKLTARGKAQAAELAEKLKDQNFDRIYCSDLQRCVDTAKYVQEKLPSVPFELTPALREINFGIFQGQLSANVDWSTVPGTFYTAKPTGGESKVEFSERVIEFVNTMYYKYPDDHLLFITHAGPMRAIRSSLKGESLEKLTHEEIENTAIWEFEITKQLTPATGA